MLENKLAGTLNSPFLQFKRLYRPRLLKFFDAVELADKAQLEEPLTT